MIKNLKLAKIDQSLKIDPPQTHGARAPALLQEGREDETDGTWIWVK